jgi:hypothetical protein
MLQDNAMGARRKYAILVTVLGTVVSCPPSEAH